MEIGGWEHGGHCSNVSLRGFILRLLIRLSKTRGRSTEGVCPTLEHPFPLLRENPVHCLDWCRHQFCWVIKPIAITVNKSWVSCVCIDSSPSDSPSESESMLLGSVHVRQSRQIRQTVFIAVCCVWIGFICDISFRHSVHLHQNLHCWDLLSERRLLHHRSIDRHLYPDL